MATTPPKGKIDVYIDIASWFSYVAFADLLSKRDAFRAHGVDVEFHPVLIAGIMAASGNQPPWKLPLKGAYYTYDLRRTAARVGLAHNTPRHRPRPHSHKYTIADAPSPYSGPRTTDAVTLAFPPAFASMSRTVIPLRALLYVKQTHGEAAFEQLATELFARFFTPPHTNVSDADVLRDVLGDVVLPFSSSSDTTVYRPLTPAEVDEIISAATSSPALKEKLRADTDDAVARLGAFGLPWVWAQRFGGDAAQEPFWGSDRVVELCAFLGVPCRDTEVAKL